ncbi:MAG: preprotein translocase subunit SecG [Luteolibacter sp.]
MTLAAIDWLSITINLVLVVFVIVCLLMTLLILMQRPKQEGLGAAFGAGVTDQVFGARTTNVLQRATVYLGSAFFLLSLLLAILIGLKNRQHTLVTPKTPAHSQAAAPAEPEKPKSLADELPAEPSAPAESPAPEEVPADQPAPADAAGETVEPAPAETAPGAVPTEPAPTPEPSPESPADKPQGQ